MAKPERRFIRIEGKLIGSPRFEGKDAKRRLDEWYAKKLKEKDFIERGLLSSNVPTFFEYSRNWMKKRVKSNPKSTWYADNQRLRAYLVPALGEMPLDRISRSIIRETLMKIQSEYKLSVVTRTRIKALASKIFSDALNENPPLVAFNPCSGIKFSDPRIGKKKPQTLSSEDEVLAFLQCAQEIGRMPALACAIAVMAGLRKSEIIPLRYRHVNWKSGLITVECHVEQASLSIKEGTKAGQEESREVYVSQSLLDLIRAYRNDAEFKGDNDFIFCDADGDWIRPRKFHMIIDKVVKAFGRPITLHKLRHTYGRMFIMKTGNQRALQDILGHKSAATTAIYSELSGAQLKPFGELMEYRKTPRETKDVTPNRHQIAGRVEGNQDDSID